MRPVEERERAGGGERRAADQVDGLGDAAGLREDHRREDVHRHAADAVAGVPEDVEVQGEARAVDPDLAEDAVLGEADDGVPSAP